MPSIATDRPLKDAVEVSTRKVAVGSAMSSREWEALQAEIKMRAMFSAWVESERLLEEMRSRLQVRIELAKKDGRTMDRGVFIEEMRDELAKAGYKRGDAKRGSLRDLKSTRRLGLIWDMNLAQMQGYARWKADMTEDGLDNEPCYELIRVMARIEHREWPVIWAQQGGKFYDGAGSNDDYPRAAGRMIAKKTDPIWRKISRFKTPWPPYDWGSGMGLRGISREESDAFGITGTGEKLVPLAMPFNSETQASAKGIPEAGRENLRSAMGDAIRFDGDEIFLQRETNSETDEQRLQDISTSLRERARAIADAGRETLTAARSSDGPLAGAPGTWEHAFDEILASTSAVAVGRKQLYHEGWGGNSETIGDLLRAYLPPAVEVMVRDGHVHAWRPDLLSLTGDEIQALSVADKNGYLLGYGSHLFDQPSVPVNILSADKGVIIGGFFANPTTATAYAKARLRDFTDALGQTLRLIIGGKEVKL